MVAGAIALAGLVALGLLNQDLGDGQAPIVNAADSCAYTLASPTPADFGNARLIAESNSDMTLAVSLREAELVHTNRYFLTRVASTWSHCLIGVHYSADGGKGSLSLIVDLNAQAIVDTS